MVDIVVIVDIVDVVDIVDIVAIVDIMNIVDIVIAKPTATQAGQQRPRFTRDRQDPLRPRLSPYPPQEQMMLSLGSTAGRDLSRL